MEVCSIMNESINELHLELRASSSLECSFFLLISFSGFNRGFDGMRYWFN